MAAESIPLLLMALQLLPPISFQDRVPHSSCFVNVSRMDLL